MMRRKTAVVLLLMVFNNMTGHLTSESKVENGLLCEPSKAVTTENTHYKNYRGK